MVGQGVHGDLFAARGPGAPGRAIPVCVQMSRARDGGFQLLCRMAASDLAGLLGAQPGGDLDRLSRHLAAEAAPRDGGLAIALDLARQKLGPPLARPVADREGDWMLGPVPLPPPGPAQSALLADYDRQGLLPLTWRGVQAEAAAGGFRLPDLLALRAVVGDGGAILLPGVQVARRRAARAAGARAHAAAAAESPALPLAPPNPRMPSGPRMPTEPPARAADPAPDRTAPGPLASGRTRAGVRTGRREAPLRLSVGADGRLGLTVPPEALDALWAGRTEAAERRCHLAVSAPGILLLPDGDPLAAHLGAAAITLRRADPNANWYGRTALRDPAAACLAALLARRGGATFRAGRDFDAEIQPGRVVLRDLLPAAEEPPLPDARPPVAEKLARARRMMTEALALVRAARSEAGCLGTPEIEFLDGRGAQLLCLPAEAAEARIRIEIG